MLKNSTYFKFWSFFFLNSKHFNFFYKFILFNLIFNKKIVNSQADMLGAPLGIFKTISKNYTFFNYKTLITFTSSFKYLQLILLFVLSAENCDWNKENILFFKKTNLPYSNTNIFSIQFLFKIDYKFFLNKNKKILLINDLYTLNNIPLRNLLDF